MICEACGNILPKCAVIEGAAVCEACAPDFRNALDEARGGNARGRARDAHFVARAMLRERGGTTQIMLRDVPVPAYRTLKIRAAEQGVSVRELILAAVDVYLLQTQAREVHHV